MMIHTQRHWSRFAKASSFLFHCTNVRFQLVHMCAGSAELTSTETYNHGLFLVLNSGCLPEDACCIPF